MPERLRQRLARPCGWLIPAALLALAPKCILCVLGYAGFGAALGFGGPEFCGPAAETRTWLLSLLGLALGLVVFLTCRCGRRPS